MPYASANIRFMSPYGWGPTIGDVAFLDRLSLNFLVRWESGDYLTWEPIPPFTEDNNIQFKDTWNVDMRISKQFDVGNFDFNLFVDVINVFDLEYLSPNGFDPEDGYFADEADYRNYMNSLHLPIYSDPKYPKDTFTAGDDKVGDVRSDDKPYINMPNLNHMAWSFPRSVILGLRIGF